MFLLGRLAARNHHFLALKICEVLSLKNDRILVHWACEKVKKMALAGTNTVAPLLEYFHFRSDKIFIL